MKFIKLTELTKNKTGANGMRMVSPLIVNRDQIAAIAEVNMVPDDVPIIGQSVARKVSMIFFENGQKIPVDESTEEISRMLNGQEKDHEEVTSELLDNLSHS